MQKICKKYAKNMSLHRLQHSKYAKNMQKICKKYAQYATKICNKYAINMQNMHKSMYLHILHIYALPTLLMQLLSLQWGFASRDSARWSVSDKRHWQRRLRLASCDSGCCFGRRRCASATGGTLPRHQQSGECIFYI